MHLPPSLKKGDRVILIAPSGVTNEDYVSQACHRLESWGLHAILGTHVLNKNGRYAGRTEERLHDLQTALDSREFQAVFCARGGYGAVHLLENISFEIFRETPKWIIGYSDITAVHSAVSKQKICSLHAPMTSHLALEGEDEATLLLKEALFGKRPGYTVPGHPLNRAGTATGYTRGGNLSVLLGLRATPFDLIEEKTILFIEDTGEKPYQIERMMYNLRLSGTLSRISGLIVGQFSEYEEDPSMHKSIYESIRQLVDDYDYPVCFNFPVGHVKRNFPLIVSGSAELNVNPLQVVLSYS